VIGPQDHCWHQYVGLELLDAEPTDDRTFEEFVADVELAARQGWDEFDHKARAPKAVRAPLGQAVSSLHSRRSRASSRPARGVSFAKKAPR